MKKIFLSIMLGAGVFGLVAGQVTQPQTGTTSSMQISEGDEGWEKIGEKTINLSEDRGIFSSIFNWNTDREKTINADEKYAAIKFKAKDAPVNMTDLEVEFEDGRKQNLSLNSPVMPHKDSRVIALENRDEKLDKITFRFERDETAPVDKAKIELWGLKAEAGSGMGQSRASQSESDISLLQDDKEDAWEKIGEKTLNLSEDRGIFSSIFNWNTDREKTINADEKYAAIKFKAKDAPVNMTDLEVEFEDGRKQNLSLNSPVMPDKDSRVIPLESRDEKLDKITFRFERDETAPVDEAKIELWGLKAEAGSGMGQSRASQSESDISLLQDDKKDAWEKIGEKTLDLTKDSDFLDFDQDGDVSVRANERYTAVKFKAKDGTVDLTNVELEYEDGTKQMVNFESPVRAESESKVVSLNQTDKKLEKINFNFKKDTDQAGQASPRSDKVDIELWGLKLDDDK
jgi:hypothetical protein